MEAPVTAGGKTPAKVKVVIRRLERFETTIIEGGCRNLACG